MTAQIVTRTDRRRICAPRAHAAKYRFRGWFAVVLAVAAWLATFLPLLWLAQ